MASPLMQESVWLDQQRYEEAEAFYYAVQAGAVQAGRADPQRPAGVPKDWVERIKQWYPELPRRTYFLPHVYMYRAKHDKTQLVSGTTVRKPPLEKDQQEDRSQQDVLDCLRYLADKRKDVMFVLSQMSFGDYLGKSSYNPAAKHFRRPVDLKREGKHKGESDVVVIHRQYGLLLGEIKSVGGNVDMLREPQEKQDKIMVRKVEEAAKQLRLGKDVLEYITSDYQPQPSVRGTLMLPNLPRSELQRLLAANPKLEKTLRECLLRPGSSDDPIDMCLCSDQKYSIDSESGSDGTSPYSLEQWWRHRMSGGQEDPAMSDEVYEDMVARFAGPATLVRVYCQTEPRLRVTDMRSEGHFVAEIGERLSVFFLHPYQVALIHAAPDLGFLAGPPGTGKTLTAVVMAMEWLRQDRAVNVLSGDDESRAAAHLIEQQLKVTARQTLGAEAADRVRLHLVYLQQYSEKEEAQLVSTVNDLVQTLMSTATNGEICIVYDEVSGNNPGLNKLYQELASHPAGFRIRLWGASLLPRSAPQFLKEHVHLMTEPLRSPPCVVREVQQADDIETGDVPKYTVPSAPPPADGPPVMYVHHQSPEHTEEHTLECEVCGREVARLLREVLHVGQNCDHSTSSTSSGSGGTPTLKFHDVFVLSSLDFDDDDRDEEGHVISPASGVVRGLRRAGVPVRVLVESDTENVAAVATMSGPDSATATCEDNVQGLERKIVVWLEEKDDKGEVIFGRLHGMSRATAQLIWVRNHVQPSEAMDFGNLLREYFRSDQ